MPTITVLAAQDAGRYAILKDDAKTEKFLDAVLENWVFETKEEDTLSLIRTGDGTIDFDLRRGKDGQYSEASYRLAYVVSYARAHVSAYSVNGSRTEQPTHEQIGKLPFDVLDAYFRKCRTGVNWDNLLKKTDSVKKSEPDNPA